MFHGSIPADMRKVLHETAADWPDDSAIAIGCSGNLTIERALAARSPGYALHSNDVNAYSCALGWYFAGEKVPFTLKPDSRPLLDWVEPYLDDGAGTLAVLMQGTTFLPFVGRVGRYYERMVDGYRKQFDRLIEQTVQRLETAQLRLASYTAADVRAWLADVPADWPVVSFPPFFSGDYTAQFAAIDEHFDWPAPEFGELDEAAKDQLIEAITDREHWLLGLHQDWPELADYRRAEVQTAQRGVPIHLYASAQLRRLVRPNMVFEQVRMPKIHARDEVAAGQRLTLHPLTLGQFNMLRSQFMSRTINPGHPLQSVAVAVDGKLIGAFAWAPPKFAPETAYLLSDFPVPWTTYRRLSKLVVMAAMSSEARTLVMRSVGRKQYRVATTAYSNNPKSAKYGRGTGLSLFKRTEGVERTDGIHRYQLEYAGAFGELDLAEAFAVWKRKHGGDLREAPC